MSREKDEMGEKQHNEQFGPRGAGDPDWYGYPGEAPLVDNQNKDADTSAETNLESSIIWYKPISTHMRVAKLPRN